MSDKAKISIEIAMSLVFSLFIGFSFSTSNEQPGHSELVIALDPTNPIEEALEFCCRAGGLNHYSFICFICGFFENSIHSLLSFGLKT
jgi:hypothetical protein